MTIHKRNIKGLKNNNFIGCWDIDDKESLKKIINYFNENKHLSNNGLTGDGTENFDTKKSIDLAVKPSEILKSENKFLHDYFAQLQSCYKDYCNTWFFLKNTITSVDIGVFNIQKYEKGGHFKGWHCERSGLNHSHRVFAWMTYLNDVNDGGNTDFLHYDISIKPVIGRTLIWPSEWTHAHRGGEVMEDKYIITGWFNFPIPKD